MTAPRPRRRLVRRLDVKVTVALVAVALVTGTVALPAAILYTERRLDGLGPAERDRVMRQIEVNSWDDFDGLAEWALVVAVAAALGTAVGVVLARRITRPLGRVGTAAAHVADGDLAARSGVRRADEIGDLARDFDTMAADLERLEQERQVAAASIAHELRTPLTVVRTRLQAARDGLLDLDDDEFDRLVGQIDGLTVLVEDLRTLSLATAGRLRVEPVPTELTALVAEEVEALRTLASARGVVLRADAPVPVTAPLDPVRLRQVVRNLVDNAVRATPAGGTVTVATAPSEDHRSVVVRVLDTGPGLPAGADLDLFRPFGVGAGAGPERSGLGLSIVRMLTELHHGTVDVTSSAAGTEVTVRLPAT